MWGQGIATMLMQRLIDFAKNQAKVELISLEVRSDNAAAIHLYEKFWFPKVRNLPGIFEDQWKMDRCRLHGPFSVLMEGSFLMEQKEKLRQLAEDIPALCLAMKERIPHWPKY